MRLAAVDMILLIEWLVRGAGTGKVLKRRQSDERCLCLRLKNGLRRGKDLPVFRER